jgi:hypothetical protein
VFAGWFGSATTGGSHIRLTPPGLVTLLILEHVSCSRTLKTDRQSFGAGVRSSFDLRDSKLLRAQRYGPEAEVA